MDITQVIADENEEQFISFASLVGSQSDMRKLDYSMWGLTCLKLDDHEFEEFIQAHSGQQFEFNLRRFRSEAKKHHFVYIPEQTDPTIPDQTDPLFR